MTLGGGAEIALHADRVQAAAETYMGLVEVGVGLIPAGGGTKEMLVRAMSALPTPQSDPLPYVQKAFETVALAQGVGQRARRAAARLSRADRRVHDESRAADRRCQGAGARTRARGLSSSRRRAPPFRSAARRWAPRCKLGVHLAWRAGRASDHDALIGRKLAHIFAGGDVPHATTVSEQYLLDLEREAFLSLLGERKTLERIQHTLKTGKPLRN